VKLSSPITWNRNNPLMPIWIISRINFDNGTFMALKLRFPYAIQQ
jgi:hypothetical protein